MLIYNFEFVIHYLFNTSHLNKKFKFVAELLW